MRSVKWRGLKKISKVNGFALRLSAILIAVWMGGVIACAKAQFSGSPTTSQASCATTSSCSSTPGQVYDYDYTTANPASDVLFVVDNSASMYVLQQNLGTHFTSFLNEIGNFDLHIGITNTDISTSPNNTVRSTLDGYPYVQDGNLYTMPDGTQFLSSSSSDLPAQFSQTVARPETLACQNWIAHNCNLKTGCADLTDLAANCPSEFTRAISAANKTVANNPQGFIRDATVPLNVVVISNADEFASGGLLPIDTLDSTDQGQTLANQVQASFPGKQFKFHSIIIQPGDTPCYNSQHINGSEFGWYGNIYNQFAQQTSGYVGSVCASDYSGILTNIANNMKIDNGDRDLPCQPQGQVDITLNPSSVQSAANVQMNANGNGWQVFFSPALPPQTQVHVHLTCVGGSQTGHF